MILSGNHSRLIHYVPGQNQHTDGLPAGVGAGIQSLNRLGQRVDITGAVGWLYRWSGWGKVGFSRKVKEKADVRLGGIAFCEGGQSVT